MNRYGGNIRETEKGECNKDNGKEEEGEK